MAKWIDANKNATRGKGGSRTTRRNPGSTTSKRSVRNRATDNATGSSGRTGKGEGAETPLAIPYGNKETAIKLGARYRPGGWYAPAGVDLAAFEERGWHVKQLPRADGSLRKKLTIADASESLSILLPTGCSRWVIRLLK